MSTILVPSNANFTSFGISTNRTTIEQDPENSSQMVNKFTGKNNTSSEAGMYYDMSPGLTNLSTPPVIKIDVYCPIISPILLKMEKGNDFCELAASNTLINQWETLTFDTNFSSNGFGPKTDFDRIYLYFNFGNILSYSSTWYIKNIRTTTTIDQIPCFLEGTQILCLIDEIEKYVPIENVVIGTKIKTHEGEYKKLIYKSKTIFDNSYVCDNKKIHKLKKINEMTDDLYITGNHIIPIFRKFKNFTVKYFVTVDKSEIFKPVTDLKICTVYNLVLNNNDINKTCSIYANGYLCESMSIEAYKKNIDVKHLRL